VKDYTLRKGAFGAIMDEYERAAADLEKLLKGMTEEQYTRAANPGTHPELVSIQALMNHVVESGYAYANQARKVFGMPSEAMEFPLFGLTEAVPRLQAMLKYTEATLEGRWEMTWEQQKEFRFETPSGNRITIELLMEHGIVHILRHRRQIEKYLAGRV
jgi:uncharacterized damage-inducible protein DinB